MWFIRLGYAYLGFVAILLLILFVSPAVIAATTRAVLPGTLAISAFSAICAWSVVKALRVERPEESAVVLDLKPTMPLNAVLENIAKVFSSRTPDEVNLSWDANAFMKYVPSAGVLRPGKHVLGLGVPLLYALTIDESKAVLGHEMAHFAGKHGMVRWRANKLFSRLSGAYENLSESGRGAWLLNGFLNVYMPKLNRIMFAQARADELEAVHFENKVATPSDVAFGTLKAVLMDIRWREEIDELVTTGRTGIDDLRQAFLSLLSTPMDETELRRNVRQIFDQRDDLSDEHPPVGDIWRTLGMDPNRRFEEIISALKTPSGGGEALLGHRPEDSLNLVLADLSHTLGVVTESIATARNEQEQIVEELLGVPAANRRADDWISLITASDGCREMQMRLAWATEALQFHPDSPRLNLVVGNLRLENGDPAGVALVQSAMDRSPDLKSMGMEILARHRAASGDIAGAKSLMDEAMEANILSGRIEHAVRTSLSLKSKFEPCQMQDGDRRVLTDQVSSDDAVESAWLVGHRFAADPSRVYPVLVIKLHSGARDRTVSPSVELDRLIKRFRDVPLNLIYLLCDAHDGGHQVRKVADARIK
jgi:hypothetical protein